MRNIAVPLIALALFACNNKKEQAIPRETFTPKQWAVSIEEAGLPNFHKLDDRLYRGAQPTEEGMRRLAELGIKTVVNLRSFHSDRDEIGDAPLKYEHLYVKAWHPEENEVVQFLKIVNNPAKQPVFVHCMHGADRTGLMCAAYRVAVCGWTKEEALREMKEGDFGFHEIWKNIKKFFDALDMDRIKKEAGLQEIVQRPKSES